MRAALIDGGHVVNVIVLADGTHLTASLAGTFGGTALIEVTDGIPVGPGWAYTPDADPPFTAPDTPDPAPVPVPAPDPVTATFGALVDIAADPATTVDEKLAGFIGVLASAAPPAPTA